MSDAMLGATVATLLHEDGAWWTEAEIRDSLRRGGLTVAATALGHAIDDAARHGLVSRRENVFDDRQPAKRHAAKWEYSTPDVTARVS